MIKFEHDGLQTSCQKTCWKGYDGANTPRCNLEVEPFVAQWIIQMKENMHKLRAIRDHMSLQGVAKKGITYYWLVLRLQKGRDVDQL
jgi:hypothetical protein